MQLFQNVLAKWSPKETIIATRRYGFLQGGIVNKLLSSERAFRELNISIGTNTESDKAIALTFPVVK
ncbi:hypothetical protein L1987_76959 [Smallanthus sonchifolius]|uniref:Uncharacterized protein n=1 Tax=Smallanthus sonchifolius TaxID=185202 RepID=A0ACB8Z9H8_9ASTR|nr:hypothetical protein L1987_76959 [Smallanthus sonchifolius]